MPHRVTLTVGGSSWDCAQWERQVHESLLQCIETVAQWGKTGGGKGSESKRESVQKGLFTSNMICYHSAMVT